MPVISKIIILRTQFKCCACDLHANFVCAHIRPMLFVPFTFATPQLRSSIAVFSRLVRELLCRKFIILLVSPLIQLFHQQGGHSSGEVRGRRSCIQLKRACPRNALSRRRKRWEGLLISSTELLPGTVSSSHRNPTPAGGAEPAKILQKSFRRGTLGNGKTR